jgi:hypothetical protein
MYAAADSFEEKKRSFIFQVSACASACLHVIQELSLLLENAVSARVKPTL